MFKPIDLHDKTSYVSPFDPAVDRDRVVDRELEEPDADRLNGMAALLYQMPFESLGEKQKRDAAWEAFTVRFAEKCGQHPSESREMLLLKDGATPTVFVVGVIVPDELNRIHDECRETITHRGKTDERAWRAFLHGLRDIQGWEGEIPKREIRGVEYVDPTWIKSKFTRGLRSIARQVGQIILAWNELTEDEAKN